ncbi:Dabb family protein [Nocardia sp. NPDC056541]|uniref:Dabb family protein n=1 Tax=Nocardia sp. NPDC056541 TaxID=3345860 RepID=UPI00366A6A0E
MFEVTRLVHLSPGTEAVVRDRLMTRVREIAAPAARRVLVEPTLPGVRNGGDVLVHLRFDESADWTGTTTEVDTLLSESPVAHVDGAEYHGGTAGIAEPDATGSVYRVLLLRVEQHTPRATVERFEADLLRMPRYLPGIRSWQLSRVARGTGLAAWTHVWEQEFADLDALAGPYLMHPVHWAHVDRWFDPECPDMIIRDRICHSFCVNRPL